MRMKTDIWKVVFIHSLAHAKINFWALFLCQTVQFLVLYFEGKHRDKTQCLSTELHPSREYREGLLQEDWRGGGNCLSKRERKEGAKGGSLSDVCCGKLRTDRRVEACRRRGTEKNPYNCGKAQAACLLCSYMAGGRGIAASEVKCTNITTARQTVWLWVY